MGQIYSGIQSIAMERAMETAKIERIVSESVEAVADEAVSNAVSTLYEEDVDFMTDESLARLIDELPDDAIDEKGEAARMIASDEVGYDIDDMVGVIDEV